jgi:hypothetical protein
MDSDRASSPPRIPQNVSADETVRRLLKLPVPRKFNIVRLRPADLPRAERFETVADVGTRRINEAARLEEIDGLGRIAARLRACTPQARCTSVCCPSCSRKFRRWFICQALRHERDLELQVLTVALELVPSNELSQINLSVLKRRTSQRIRRAAPSVRFVLGGIEADYRQTDDAFLVHAHLLVSRLPRDEVKALRSAFAEIGVTRAIKVQPLRDPVTQISYLLKFTTFHRPGSQNSSRRPSAIPLPSEALKQLTLWRAQHGFLDFVFMTGLRRRGGDLVQIEDAR